MNKKKEINGYVETLYGVVPVGKNTDIKVLTSERLSDGYVMVDIRKFNLYGNTFDGIKRPTKKGIKFRLSNIKMIIVSLMDILVAYDMLEKSECDVLKQQLISAVK